MRKAIKNYEDPTAAATASDAVTYTVNKDSIKDAASSYELKDPVITHNVAAALIDNGSGSKTSGKSKKAIYIAVAVVAVVAAIFIIRKK